jgi:hypothetical protein
MRDRTTRALIAFSVFIGGGFLGAYVSPELGLFLAVIGLFWFFIEAR